MFAHYAKANFRDHDDNENVLMTSLDKLTMLLLMMTPDDGSNVDTIDNARSLGNYHQYGNSDDSDIDDDDADVDDVGNLVDYHQ